MFLRNPRNERQNTVYLWCRISLVGLESYQVNREEWGAPGGSSSHTDGSYHTVYSIEEFTRIGNINAISHSQYNIICCMPRG